MTARVRKLGGSLAVVIPKAVAQAAGWAEGTALGVSATAAGVVLTRQGRRPRRPLSEIVAQLEPASYRRRGRDLSGDGPVGREVG